MKIPKTGKIGYVCNLGQWRREGIGILDLNVRMGDLQVIEEEENTRDR